MFFQRGLYMITKLNNRELFQFCEQFSIILRSGMSAIEGLAILNDDSQTERGKEILTFLYKDMEESGSLAHAMEQSGAFPASAAYVRTGEETGCLDEVMKGLSAFYAKEIQITDQIQSAVAYPLVMLGMMTAVIVILLVKVLPVFRQVFRQLGLEMSGISGALLGIGETLSRYSTAFLVLLAAMIAVPVRLRQPTVRHAGTDPQNRLPFSRHEGNSGKSGLQSSLPMYFPGNPKRTFP